MNAADRKLVVLSWAGGWGRALREAVSEPFGREMGVSVEQLPHIGLKLPSALSLALSSGDRPPVDVVWSNSVPALLAAMRGECLSLDLERQAASELFNRAWPSDIDGYRVRDYVVHPYVVYYVLVYNEGLVPRPPTSWRELLEPEHRHKIALYPGGNGFYPIAQLLGGGSLTGIPHDMDACWSFMRLLRSQIGQLEYSIGMEERLRRGDLTLCFRALTNALAFREAGVPAAWCIPSEGTTDTVDALWIPRGVPETTRDLARRYIHYALRPDVQRAWCERLGAMPVHKDAPPPTVLRSRADLPTSADDYRGVLRVPETLKVRHEAEWEATFRSIIG